MPVTTRSAVEREQRRSAETLGANADALALLFLRLPPKEQVLTIGALSTAWHQWAAQRLDAFWAGLSATERALAAGRAASKATPPRSSGHASRPAAWLGAINTSTLQEAVFRRSIGCGTKGCRAFGALLETAG